MTAGPSIGARAVLAVVLLVVFYALSIGLVGFLVWAPLQSTGSTQVKLALACWICAGIVAWSIVPRFWRAPPPGPRLERESNPRLFEELDSIARQTGQPVPADVYLVPDVNAFVSQSGGWMGFGGRRMLGLGLGLMSAFDVAELRGVIAHEFGHFTGGDTRLGPWIYATRGALERTLENLERGKNRVPIVLVQNALWISRMPYRAFHAGFMRITSAVARSQELSADRLAARIAGTQAAVSGLAKLRRTSAAFELYLDQEFNPLLRSGHRAPFAAGFREFLASDTIQAQLEASQTQAPARAGPYDTHPPPSERIRALTAAAPAGEDSRQAGEISVNLLGDLDACERALLGFGNGDAPDSELGFLEWNDLPQRVLLPGWRQACAKHAQELAGIRLGQLGRVLQERKDRAAESRVLFARAAALALVENGWEIRTSPGEPVHVTREQRTLDPFARVDALADSELSADEWSAWCESAGVAALPLWRA